MQTELIGRNILISKRTLSKAKVRSYIFVFFMLILALVNFAVFFVYVNFSSIMLAFESPSKSGLTIVNFEMIFRELFRGDSVLVEAFTNTFIFFCIGLLVIFPLSLIFSFFLFKKIRCYKLFRVVFFLPNIISVVVLTTLFKYFFESEGPVFQILVNVFGVAPDNVPVFFADSKYALSTIIGYCIWTGFGVNIILFNSAMSRIPDSVLEYARIDGVSMPRELVQIIIPLMWPTISTMIILGLVNFFNSSGPILFFTLGQYKTYTLSYWIFERVYMSLGRDVNMPAAMGVLLTIFGLPLVLIVRYVLSKIGQDIEY